MAADPKLIDKLSTRLTEAGRLLLDSVRACAARAGLRLFLVGGSVRDLLLERDSLDVDVAVEGDARELARQVAEATGAKLAKTTEFGTATLRAGTFALDLATARAETYARPGALPKVRPSTIDADLLRRDFTINAIALELSGDAPGKLLDPTGGSADLRAGQVRILHDRSFEDDATRILRAARYEARFGFRLEERTLDLLRRDLSYIGAISGTRVRHELERTFREGQPERALGRLQELGVLVAIHPALDAGPRVLARWVKEPASPGRYAVDWALLAFAIRDTEVDGLIRRLALTRKQAEAVRSMPSLRALAPRLTGLRSSRLAEALAPIPEAALMAYAAAGDPEQSRPIRDYLLHMREVRPILRGDDLIALGVPEGPAMGTVLDRLRAARLDGEVHTRTGEERLVRRYLATRKRKTVA